MKKDWIERKMKEWKLMMNCLVDFLVGLNLRISNSV